MRAVRRGVKFASSLSNGTGLGVRVAVTAKRRNVRFKEKLRQRFSAASIRDQGIDTESKTVGPIFS